MNLPTRVETPWESSDAAALREFLESKTGQRALMHLGSQMPGLLDGGDNGKTLVRSGEVKGWTNSLQALLNLTVEEPSPNKIPEAYPSIDDENSWEDKTTNP